MHEGMLIACTTCVDCTEFQSVLLPTMVLNHLYTSMCLESLVDVCAGMSVPDRILLSVFRGRYEGQPSPSFRFVQYNIN